MEEGEKAKSVDRFLDPRRLQWQDPDAVLDALGPLSGLTFADVGCGPGFFTLPAARRIGPDGTVYALDTDPRMIARLRERALEAGLTNIEYIVPIDRRLPISDQVVDVVLLANVLHEVPDQAALLVELARVTRLGGTLAVIEWRKQETPGGPPLTERLTPEAVAASLEAVGFGSLTRFEAGPHHFAWKARVRRAS